MGLEGPARPGAAPGQRVVAAAGAAGLAAAALAWLVPDPAVSSEVGAAGAAVLTVLLPRLGWLAVAVILCVLLAVSAPGAAVVVVLAALPVAPLLRRAAPGWWSAPAAAPLLGALALGVAWPAVAGQAGRAWHRAALGALGLWWLTLAEILTGERLLLGPPAGAGAPDAESLTQSLDAVALVPASGTAALALLWAVMAAALPAVVRGRSAAADLVGATGWAAALASATQALSAGPAAGGAGSQPRGLIVGALLSVVLVVGGRAARAAA